METECEPRLPADAAVAAARVLKLALLPGVMIEDAFGMMVIL